MFYRKQYKFQSVYENMADDNENMEDDKCFISPNDLRLGAVQLARKIYDDRFVPNRIVGLWRGGAPIGLYVHEALKRLGIRADYIPVITRGYEEGIDNQLPRVAVQGIDSLAGMTRTTDKVLIVDDVWDTGRSIDTFIAVFEVVTGQQHPPDVRVGTVYFKPARNLSKRRPHYFVYESNRWLVFPHEMGSAKDCTDEELRIYFGQEIADILLENKKSQSLQ